MAIGFYGDESESEGQVFTLAGFMAAPQGWSLWLRSGGRCYAR